jgi:hypothetical protein
MSAGMGHNSAAMQDTFPAKLRRPKRRLPRFQYDRRSRIGRRTKALARIYSEKLGPAASDPLMQAQIQRTASLVALSEQVTAKAIAGEDVPPDDIVRLNRLCDLNLRRLRLDRHDVKPRGQSLGDLLQQDRSSFDATAAREG